MGVKVDVKLTVMKPLHAKWLSEFYNFINSLDGQDITGKVWLRVNITDAINPYSANPTKWSNTLK